MRKNKKRLALLLFVVAIVCAMSCVLAYFTDYETADVEATAGTLDIALSESWDASNVNRENAKPGDIYNLDYTVKNNGNKSADVRETYVIRSTVAMTAAAPEFQIYAAGDVEKAADGTYGPKAGKKPVVTGVLSNGNKTITFSLPEFAVDGTGIAAETGDASASGNGFSISKNVMTGDYVILFSRAASNSFQGAEVSIDYLAEAKQHRNTDNTVWGIVASETINFAGSNVKAVPAA